jgi:hypothetical protein
MGMRHEFEIELNGRKAHLSAASRIDENYTFLIVHDIFVQELMLGTVYPSINEHTGRVEWETRSDLPQEIVDLIGKSIERTKFKK